MGLLNIVLLAAILSTGFAEVARYTDCEDASDDVCKISEVRITPCKKSDVCTFKKGRDASMSFDFTPNFTASKLKTEVYWANGAMDIVFEDFGSNDGCLYTSCPTQAGQQQNLTYNMHVSKKLPQGIFTLKWKLWNEEDEKQFCCFKATIKLRR